MSTLCRPLGMVLAMAALLATATLAMAADMEEANGRAPHEAPAAIPAIIPIEDVLARENGSDRDDGEYLAQPQDHIISDDLIATFSQCLGNDCVNGEAFGFSTLRLKENNLRIEFMDTSALSGYASNDWQIIINDSANGGANYFGIDDLSGGRSPFRIYAGAPTNSLRIDRHGDLGLGIDDPVVEVHLRDGDTPTVRLDQDGSSGWSPQVWDLAGNETNFFIRDVTHASRLVFRIRPAAPSNSIYVDSDGDVGLGTAAPSERLHVEGSIFATESIMSTGMIQANNNICVGTETPTSTMEIHGEDASVYIKNTSSSVVTWVLTPQGNMVISGNLFEASSRELKENFVPLDSEKVLDQLDRLELGTWNYKSEDPSVSHVGPVAEDWAEIFELNPDDTHISPSDMSGVALGAIQALHREVQAKDAQIAQLEARLAAIEAMLQSSGGS